MKAKLFMHSGKDLNDQFKYHKNWTKIILILSETIEYYKLWL